MKTHRCNNSKSRIAHYGPTWARATTLVSAPSLAHMVVLLMVAVAGLFAASRMTAQTKAKAAKPNEASAGNAENGKRLFLKDGCYECHGREAQGGGYNGPRLAPDPPPLAVIIAYVRKPAGEMPPYTEKVISDRELADIYVFLESVPTPPNVKTVPSLK